MAEIIDLQSRRDKWEKEQTEADPKLLMVMEGLREWVDNSGVIPGRINSLKVDSLEIGYRVTDKGITMTREVFIRFEQPIHTIPDEQKDPVLLAAYEIFLMEGQGAVSIGTFQYGNVNRRNSNTHDVIKIAQDFSPLVLVKGASAKTHIKIDDDIERLIH